MKLLTNAVKRGGLLLLFSFFWAIPAYGQQGKIDIESVERLAQRAVQSIDVTVDEALIKLAGSFLKPDRDSDEAKIKEILNGLKGIYVRRYVFEKEGEFSDGDTQAIRSQLSAPGWTRIVGVRSKKQDRNLNVDVFLLMENNTIRGLAALATEPRAVTVVNIVGPIDIEKLSQLEGRFGIPSLGIEQEKPNKNKDKQP